MGAKGAISIKEQQIGWFLWLVSFVGVLFCLVPFEKCLLNMNALERVDDVSKMQKGSKFESQGRELAAERMSIDSQSEYINGVLEANTNSDKFSVEVSEAAPLEQRQHVCENEIQSDNDESGITTFMGNGNGKETTERTSIVSHSESVNGLSETLTLARRLAYEHELQQDVGFEQSKNRHSQMEE